MKQETEKNSENVPMAIQLQNEVKETVENLSRTGGIRKGVIDKLVQEEVVNLGNLLAKALIKRKEQAGIINKIKPDQCSFDVTGAVVAQNWSKERLQEKQKAIQKLVKIDKVIDTAVNDADYSGIKQVVGE